MKRSYYKAFFIIFIAFFTAFGAVFFLPKVIKAESPVISDIQTYVDLNTVTIHWATDVTTTSKVMYGTSSGNYTNEVSSEGTNTSHQVSIRDLEYETTYYYQISATDIQDNTTLSEESSFTTSSQDLRFEEVTVVDSTFNKAMVYAKTNKPAYDSVKYGTSPDNLTMDAKTYELGGMDGLYSWKFFLENLEPETTYYFAATANRYEFYHQEDESVTSEVISLTTTGTPQIDSIAPDEGPPGTEVTISGQNFGNSPNQDRGGRQKIAVGCDIGPNAICLADLISWSDSNIIIKTNEKSQSGPITVNKYFDGGMGNFQDFFTIKGPDFTVTGETEEIQAPTTLTTPTTSTTPTPTPQYVTEAYGCSYSTIQKNETTVQVSSLFTKNSDTDNYLSSVYNAYHDKWGRYPRCEELQFHLDHSTPLETLNNWLQEQTIKNKYGCNFSTTIADDNTVKLTTLFTLNSNMDKYLGNVYNDYYEKWSRYPRCDELQFHADHNTSLDRLNAWLSENIPEETTIIKGVADLPGKRIEFTDTGTKVKPKDAGAKLEFTEKEQITFSGTTIPNALVVLTVASKTTTYTTTSNDNGEWFFTLPGPLEPGEHSAKVAIFDETNKKVSESAETSFIIKASTKRGTATQKITETTSIDIWLIVGAIIAAVIFILWYLIKRPKAI